MRKSILDIKRRTNRVCVNTHYFCVFRFRCAKEFAAFSYWNQRKPNFFFSYKRKFYCGISVNVTIPNYTSTRTIEYRALITGWNMLKVKCTKAIMLWLLIKKPSENMLLKNSMTNVARQKGGKILIYFLMDLPRIGWECPHL